MVRLLGLIAAACITRAPLAAAQPVGPVTDGDQVSIAATVVAAGPTLAKIWPGYWPLDQAFIYHDPARGALLVSPSGARPPAFRPLSHPSTPKLLLGRAFEHAGGLADVRTPFRLDHPIGQGRTAILVQTRAGQARAAAELAFHEQFHAYQRAAFKGGRGSQFIDPAAIADRAAFSASADIERRLLAAALRSQSKRNTSRLLHQYLALRREREVTVPAEVSSVEGGFELLEGTARYVELQASTAAFGEPAAAVRQSLIEQLGTDLGARGGPYLSTWFRHRSYAVGAAICFFLERLSPGWRTAVEGGARLDQLLAEALHFEEGPANHVLARSARDTFGYAQRLQELEPAILKASQNEITTSAQFYALAPYRMTLFYRSPRVNGRSAVTLGLASTSMSQLTPSQMVVPAPEVVSASMPSATLTVRKHPFLRDSAGGAEQLVALLPGAPVITGRSILPPGDHRLPNILLKAEGYELKVDAPVTVAVTANSMTITAEITGSTPANARRP